MVEESGPQARGEAAQGPLKVQQRSSGGRATAAARRACSSAELKGAVDLRGSLRGGAERGDERAAEGVGEDALLEGELQGLEKARLPVRGGGGGGRRVVVTICGGGGGGEKRGKRHRMTDRHESVQA